MFVVVQFSRTVVFVALPSSAHVVYHICSRLSILFSKVFSNFLTFFHLLRKWIYPIVTLNHLHTKSTFSPLFFSHFPENFFEISRVFLKNFKKFSKIFLENSFNFSKILQMKSKIFTHSLQNPWKNLETETAVCYNIR